jgi:hypothetical protein
MFYRNVVLSSSGSESARRVLDPGDKDTIICLSVSDMEEHPRRLE